MNEREEAILSVKRELRAYFDVLEADGLIKRGAVQDHDLELLVNRLLDRLDEAENDRMTKWLEANVSTVPSEWINDGSTA